MEYSTKPFFLFCITLLLLAHAASSESEESTLQISSYTTPDPWQDKIPLYDGELGDAAFDEEELIAAESASTRRSLFWGKVFHYYISYGALSANRVPCPPRSGRSYYTHNCYRARGPVHPYSRGCSAITRCRR